LIAGAFGAAFVVASGAFFVEALFQAPSSGYPPIALAETTGKAPAHLRPAAAVPARSEAASPTDCQTQTWPHIARPCLPNEQGSRGVRMITTDKLTEPAISVIEKPPANMIHPMPPPPASPHRSSMVAVNAAPPPLSGAALSALAFAGRFQGLPETDKFELASTPAVASQPGEGEAKSVNPAAQKSAVKKQVKQAKQKNKRQVARLNGKQSNRPAAVTNRADNTASSSFSSAPGGFPNGGPFGGLFGSRANQ
jgi:hypothetical protein